MLELLIFETQALVEVHKNLLRRTAPYCDRHKHSARTEGPF